MKFTSSPKLDFLLQEMGLNTIEKIIDHLPRRYESFAYTPKEVLRALPSNKRLVLLGEIITPIKLTRFAKASRCAFYIRDQYGDDYQIIAFNRPYLGKVFKTGDQVTIAATYDDKRHCLNAISIKKGEVGESERLVPVYSLSAEYPQHSYSQLVRKCLELLNGRILDLVPKPFREKYRLLSKQEAYWKCHFPKSEEDVKSGLRVLKYEEALRFTLHNLLVKQANQGLVRGSRFPVDRERLSAFIASLPYKLTSDQQKAVLECLTDMESPHLMTWLLQGDVGTGKTLVAATLAYASFTRGEQTAILAPTESLSKQHFAYFSSLLADKGVNVGLLTGQVKGATRRRLLSSLRDGTIDVLVGTHALFSGDVYYPNLGLAIIDEQHKFGVNQRSRLLGKGENADLLLMSATPIPRTLSLTLYGDLDVSTLSVFPFSKRDVETKIVPSSLPRVAATIKKALGENRQCYVICPHIEGEGVESAKRVFEDLDARLPGYCVLLHGGLEEEEKEAALESFRSGQKPVLVATSIVEVGIDVKKASYMFVFSPTSFALSSLHQLRGRIGRDGAKAHFYLCAGTLDDEEREKLEVLVNSNDGFEIAEADLRLRGPGTLAGTKQSGFPDFSFASPVNDLRMFECAREDALSILSKQDDPEYRDFLLLCRQDINMLLA